ncbi:MAG: SoxR reducing system RseC family protein [Calditrichaceae bacterium]|nr:SoxR reducing system RseC family protein [Calditrichaceae bacterium]
MNENCVSGKISGMSLTHYFISIDSEGDCKGCGMSGVCSSKTIELEKTSVTENFKVGEKISLQYEKVIQTSIIVYMLPIAFFFLGIILSKWLFHIENEIIQFLNAMIATGLALWLVHYINNHFSESKFKVNIKPIT